MDWSGLSAGTKYLGAVTHHNVSGPADYRDGLLRATIVRIDSD